MKKIVSAILTGPSQAWDRVYRYLHTLSDREVAAWGSALQYKRYYTNPDSAKRARKGV